MQAAIKRRLRREQERAAARQRQVGERPWQARCGIWGPRHFRTLYGAQGWVDANWTGGSPEIANLLTGARYRRVDGNWTRIDAAEPADAGERADTAPYWMRPL